MSIFKNRGNIEEISSFEQEFFHNASIAMADVDNHKKIMYANEAFAKLTGYSLSKLNHLPVSRIFEDTQVIDEHLKNPEKPLNRSYDTILKNSKSQQLWVNVILFTSSFIQAKSDRCRLVVFDVTSEREGLAKLKTLNWLFNQKADPEKYNYNPEYGDVTLLNTDGIILKSVGREMLKTITQDVIELLDTSLAIYEKNGDYAFGMFESNWCKLMDLSSRRLCGDVDNKTALNGGKWLCHENCWNDSAKAAINSGKSTDIQCVGGIRLFAEPIFANGNVIGVINIGYGDSPDDITELRRLSSLFQIDLDLILKFAKSYEKRPPFIVNLAKRRLKNIAILIGEIVESKINRDALVASENKFKLLSDVTFEGIIVHKKGVIEDVNKSFCNITGFSKEEVIGAEVLSFIDESSHDTVIENFKKDHAKPYKVMVKRKNGELFLVELEARNISHKEDYFRIVAFRDIAEREKTQKALENSNKRYETLINQAPEMLFVHDESARFVEVNNSTISQYGYTRDELLHMSIQDIDPDFMERDDINTLWKKVHEHKPIVFKGRHKKKDGSIFPVEISITKVVLDDVVHYFSMAKDISERVRIEEELKAREERFRTMLENIPDPVMIQDANTGLVLMANQSTIDKYGYSREELYKMTPYDFDAPEEHSKISERFQDLKKYKVVRFNTRHITKQGDVINVEYHGRYMEYEGKELLLSICRDITEQVLSAEKLKQNEEMYRLLAENSVDCIWQMDKRLKFTYLSPALMLIGGPDPREWVGTNLWEHTTKLEFIKMARPALSMMKKGNADKYVILEARMFDKDQKLVPLEIIIKPYYRDGKLAGLQGSTRLIIDRVKRREELREHRENLEKLVKERTEELEKKNKELMDYNRVFVGREFRIKELREKEKKLKKKLIQLTGNTDIDEILKD